MKKVLLLVMTLLSSFLVINMVKAEETVDSIYIHYYRYSGDYADWNVWGWQTLPTSEEGESFTFSTDETAAEYNYGGVVTEIDIAETFPDVERIGLIIRRGDWLEKDGDADRYIDIPETTSNGEFHIYFVEGDSSVGTSLNDVDGPDKFPKFKSAYFTSMYEITFSATESIVATNIQLKIDGIADNNISVVTDESGGTVTVLTELDFSKSYVIEATFSSDSSVNEYTVTYDGIYDSEAFETAYAYDGELGAIVDGDETIFRVWAPISDSIDLNIYSTGTPLIYGGSDTPVKTVAMTKGIKGTFSYTESENLHGSYYTYSVTNGSLTNEVVDPYAKGVGINGLRGLVVDFSQTNPDGFTYNDRPANIDSYTDAIIYELHVRDLTTDSTWNGSEENRGKYLGLIEAGTTYENVKTGFDHIVDLGVTHVQLLPFFDYGVVDESKLDDDEYNSFNWGYMPLNFNALEGTYSSDPYDGLERISEMKQVITAYGDAEIRINMDVVYNHHGLTANSNFELLVPGYYFRKTSSGAFSNGSGTGNETASERAMMSKFIIDPTVFWASEYNISGFRFDLMGLHDTETMNQLTEELRAIDPTIMVYGEPWTGGTTPLPEAEKADKTNLAEMTYVGAFNDDIRDGIKGSVFAREQGGYIQGDFSEQYIAKVKYGIVGGIAYPGVNGSKLSEAKIWHTEPIKTINYVACHDNNTLYDKLYLTLEEDGLTDLITPLQKQAYGIVLTSQGISFIHAGDEFLRSKPLETGSGFDHNSYESLDSVNQIKWNLKTSEDGFDVYNYIKGLIELRKEHASFRMDNSIDILANLDFVYEDEEGVIAYSLTNTASSDEYENILVIQNANDKNVRLKLPTNGGWVLIVDEDEANIEIPDTFLGGKTIKVAEHSTYVLYQDQTIEDYNPIPTIIILSISGFVAVVGAVALFVIKRKK
ncbi:MAG: type I pullulanase [Tenericutes bacterium]|nr:type I pullulanase [Mycoplasmatota bacterium]